MEHFEHICQILASKQMSELTNDNWAFWDVSTEIKVMITTSDKGHLYGHVPKSVQRRHESKVTILWNENVENDKSFPNNKPGIIIRDNEKERP